MVTVNRYAAVLAVAGLLGASAPGSPATAEQEPEFALAVTPSRIAVSAGQVSHDTVTVINRGRRPMEVAVTKRDMRADETGTVQLVEQAPYSARSWVTTDPEHIHVPPGEKRDVEVRVELPERYEPGDHHLALLFVSPTSERQGNIRVNSGVGVPVYITAPGRVDRSVEAVHFGAPRFRAWGPVTFSSSFRHTGTVHRDFRGDDALTIQVGSRTVDMPEFSVMRDSTRQVTARWDDPPLLCVCRAQLAVPGPDGNMKQMSATVVILPLHLFALGLVVIVGTVLLHLRRRRQRRS